MRAYQVQTQNAFTGKWETLATKYRSCRKAHSAARHTPGATRVLQSMEVFDVKLLKKGNKKGTKRR